MAFVEITVDASKPAVVFIFQFQVPRMLNREPRASRGRARRCNRGPNLQKTTEAMLREGAGEG